MSREQSGEVGQRGSINMVFWATEQGIAGFAIDLVLLLVLRFRKTEQEDEGEKEGDSDKVA
jgi:hypothetical protein